MKLVANAFTKRSVYWVTQAFFLLFLHIPCWSVITAVCLTWCEDTIVHDATHIANWQHKRECMMASRVAEHPNPAIIRLMFSKKLLHGMPSSNTTPRCGRLRAHPSKGQCFDVFRFATVIQLYESIPWINFLIHFASLRSFLKFSLLSRIISIATFDSTDSVFICPIAIAYSMGQIIKSVCVLSVCLSVRLRALSRSHFLIDFHPNWHRRKYPQKEEWVR